MFHVLYGIFSVDKALLVDTTSTKMVISPQQCFSEQSWSTFYVAQGCSSGLNRRQQKGEGLLW